MMRLGRSRNLIRMHVLSSRLCLHRRLQSGAASFGGGASLLERTCIRIRFRDLPSSQRGATLIEVLVAIGLSAILLPALATAVITSREGRAQDMQRTQAALLQREAIEAVRSVRQNGWTGVATNGTYYPSTSGGNWTLTSGTETTNGFTRSITISDVQRASASGAIVTSGGTTDPSTKKATISVGWSTPIATTISTDIYLQRFFSNAAWTQTTQASFNTGTTTNTVTTNNSGGEVQLATTPGTLSWSSPTVAGSYDVPSSTADAVDVYVDTSTNRAYVVYGSILRILNVATPASPVSLGTYTAAGAIASVYVSGNYAYLATAANSAELVVVNVSNPASPTGTNFDLNSTNDAMSVVVSGSYAYIGRLASGTGGVDEFFVVNISTPTSPSVSGSLNLPNNVNSVYVSGTVAYLATANTAGELTIVNVATPASPAQLGVYNAVGTGTWGSDVFAVGTTVYLAENNNTAGAEFFIINAATPASPTLTGSYEYGASLNGVSVSGTNAFLASDKASQQFLVLNLTTPSAPSLTSTYNTGATINDLYFNGTNAFLGSSSDTQELTIMQGTLTGGGYQASGTFESSSFDATASAAFNYLTFTITEPASTDVQFQLAVNTDNVTWNYFGPDGTSGTYFSAAGAVPLSKINGRYIRYKATLTGNGTVTPVMQDVSVNYSP